jgi:hypothetical protein
MEGDGMNGDGIGTEWDWMGWMGMSYGAEVCVWVCWNNIIIICLIFVCIFMFGFFFFFVS